MKLVSRKKSPGGLFLIFKDLRNTLLMNESLKVDKVVDGLITNNRHVSTAHNPTYHSQFRFVSVEYKVIQESHREIKIELLLWKCDGGSWRGFGISNRIFPISNWKWDQGFLNILLTMTQCSNLKNGYIHKNSPWKLINKRKYWKILEILKKTYPKIAK